MSVTRQEIDAAFDWQIAACARLGSPFTAMVLECIKADFESGGAATSILKDWSLEPVDAALTLRLAGAVQFLVLSGKADDLARFYPPKGTPPGDDRTAHAAFGLAVSDALEAEKATVVQFIERPVQTNEVGRSACLLGGFLTVARETGLPLATFEIGASGGLNSLWDRYAYRLLSKDETAHWGDSASTTHLPIEWHGAFPPLDTPVGVVSRQACDLTPIDLADPSAALRTRAYIWPDQPERLARFDGAVALFRSAGLKVEAASAPDWLAAKLADPVEGSAQTVFHSIMWQYMPDEARAATKAVIEERGMNAMPSTPFAWLRMEPEDGAGIPVLLLTLWPGGETRKLADCHPHGTSLRWLG